MKMTILSLFLFVLVGCGVRGNPEPPLIPAYLGRGQPTYKRATENMNFKNLPPVGSENLDNKKQINNSSDKDWTEEQPKEEDWENE